MLNLIVMAKSGIIVQCLYYGYKRENMVSSFKTLCYGDILTISNEGKYVLGVGWFILVMINGDIKEYVRIVELENAINSNIAQSAIEIMLDSFLLSLQLDRALELRNKELFLSLSKKQQETSFLFGRISAKLRAKP